MRTRSRAAALAPALALLALSAGCAGNRNLTDPMVRVQTEGGTELGVSTDYGVVFLGRSAARGPVTVEATFGDGPSLERSIVEPVGGGLFTAAMEIDLPRVPVSFRTPQAGEALVIAGRDAAGTWERSTRVIADERVFGLLVEPVGDVLERREQVGAGVFRELGKDRRELVGLVSGRIVLDGRERLAVVGPEVLWRLVAHRRDLLRRKPWVYREDVN